LITLHEILERARTSGQKLPHGEATWLFAAVTRLAAAQGATIRARLVQIDPAGALHVAPFDAARSDDDPGYLAPELSEPAAPLKTEPRVQVYAAGALGYELLTGQRPPDPRKGPGVELSGPFGDLVRIALSRDRRERFGDLKQLRQAVDSLQRPAGAENERHAFATLLARSEKWVGAHDLDRAALAKLIEQVAQQVQKIEGVRSGMADVQRDHRDLEARVTSVESRRPASLSISRPSWPAGIVGGILGAALAVAFLVGAGAVKLPPVALRLPARPATTIAVTALTATSTSTASPTSTPTSTPTVASIPIPTPVSTSTANTTSTPIPTPAPAVDKVSPAEMARAVAEAQVKRGDRELERGRYDAAVEEFQQALANDATLAPAWRGLGVAHLMRHDEESARKAYEKYLQLSPAAADARDIRRAIAELNARAKMGNGLEK